MPRSDNYYGKPLKLSPRETEILKWAACGKTSAEIATLLSISLNTVNAHIRSVCLKLDAVNKTHAVAIALVHGVLPLAPSPEMVIPLSALLGLRREPSSQATPKLISHNTKDKPQAA